MSRLADPDAVMNEGREYLAPVANSRLHQAFHNSGAELMVWICLILIVLLILDAAWGGKIRLDALPIQAPVFPTALQSNVLGLNYDYFVEIWERKLLEAMPFISKEARQYGYPIYNETRATLKKYAAFLAQQSKFKGLSGGQSQMASNRNGTSASIYAPPGMSNNNVHAFTAQQASSIIEFRNEFENISNQLARMEAVLPKMKAIHDEIKTLHPFFKQMMRGFDKEGQHEVLQWLLQHYQVMYNYLVSSKWRSEGQRVCR